MGVAASLALATLAILQRKREAAANTTPEKEQRPEEKPTKTVGHIDFSNHFSLCRCARLKTASV